MSQFFRLYRSVTGIGLLLLLQACASSPTPDVTEPAVEPEPELNLNLTEQSGECVAPGSVDYNFLEKGIKSLLAGDHIEAVTYFQQYQRLEATPVARWEGDIAIAYDSILPQSPFYDPEAARESYQRLKDTQPAGVPVHDRVLIMRDALATFDRMQREIISLRADRATLEEDLEKREEALRRLRELTLGQKGAAP